jgi:hypothetical protein
MGFSTSPHVVDSYESELLRLAVYPRATFAPRSARCSRGSGATMERQGTCGSGGWWREPTTGALANKGTIRGEGVAAFFPIPIHSFQIPGVGYPLTLTLSLSLLFGSIAVPLLPPPLRSPRHTNTQKHQPMGSRTKKRASPEPRSDSESPQKRARNPAGKENTANKNNTVQNVVPALSAVAAVPPAFSKRQPTECGVLTRIHCENFMCHRSFTIDLCRNVNFIYGQNGSGKSAMLAAIQICLGAGARRTHRARNVQDLVRTVRANLGKFSSVLTSRNWYGIRLRPLGFYHHLQHTNKLTSSSDKVVRL